MDKKVMYKNKDSHILIANDKLYVWSNKYNQPSPKAITIVDGFQVELGRDIKEIKEAMKEVRLPVMFKVLMEHDSIKHIQVVRMHTNVVDDKIIAILICENDIIKRVSFNRDLVKDANYRRYNKLSVLHQFTLSYNLSGTGFSFRKDQVVTLLRIIFPGVNYSNIEIIEDNVKLMITLKRQDCTLKLLMISNTNNNNNFEMMSIGI